MDMIICQAIIVIFYSWLFNHERHALWQVITVIRGHNAFIKRRMDPVSSHGVSLFCNKEWAFFSIIIFKQLPYRLKATI
jgi:hypothetical protein